MDQHYQPPNSALTAQERETRVHLKKLFREQQIRSKLAMRLSKAASRGEVALVEATRQALHEFDQRAHPATTTASCACHGRDGDRDPREVLAGSYIEQIYQEMQKTWRAAIETDSSTDLNTTTTTRHHPRASKNHANPQYTPRHVKERRLEESQRLLQSMSKGTQTLCEFRNPEALRGYTRQKFMERANLVVRSLVRLHRRVLVLQQQQHPSELDPSSSSTDMHRHATMLERLRQVRSVCSVGCGPGGETVGVVAFLQSHPQRTAAGTPTAAGHHSEHDNHDFLLDRILFCDWALSDWRPMLESVKECLVEQQRIVRQVDMATCDVRVSLRDSARSPAGELSTHCSGDLPGESTVAMSSDGYLLQALTFSSTSSSNSVLPRHQLVVASFLLSETRGQWHVFFDDLVDVSPEGTLFLLTDPTAWQLHLFRQRYEFFDRPHDQRRRMEFCWLDSSMYRPELQVLPARLSSAVLLGMVVSTIAEHGGAPES